MPILFHPKIGTVVLFGFQKGFVAPEMVKRRPAIVISPHLPARKGLCTVVPISTEVPRIVMPYHVELPNLSLPAPWDEGPNWAKADMVYSVSFSRVDLFRSSRDETGKRIYGTDTLPPEDFLRLRKAVLCGLGLVSLTKYLSLLTSCASAALPATGSALKTPSGAAGHRTMTSPCAASNKPRSSRKACGVFLCLAHAGRRRVSAVGRAAIPATKEQVATIGVAHMRVRSENGDPQTLPPPLAGGAGTKGIRGTARRSRRRKARFGKGWLGSAVTAQRAARETGRPCAFRGKLTTRGVQMALLPSAPARARASAR